MKISNQKGLSLIELMIAMLLGLLIIAGVISIFVASNKSTKYTDGLRSMQENGRQAIFLLKSAIRQAGYSSINDIRAVDITNSGASSITLRMESDFDCTGMSTTAALVPGIADNTYFLNTSEKQIMCQGSVGSVPQPVSDNIELFQVLYGIDANRDGVVEGYVRHAEVTNAYDIQNVQVAVLVVTDLPIKDRPSSKTYYVLDASKVTNDSYGRQVFMVTANIRNRMP